MIKANQTVLFQGDSITDAGRVKDITAVNYGFGCGYPLLIAASLLGSRPKDDLKFYNRGISGDRVTRLWDRWEADALALKPDLISILVGVNDTWHKFKSDTGTSLEVYEETFRTLLQTTRARLPATRLVLCEPFALACGGFEEEWLAELKVRSAIVQKLVKEFDATFVPFQKLFDDLTQEAPAEYWLPDGVHPSYGAHQRMAEFWKKQVGV